MKKSKTLKKLSVVAASFALVLGLASPLNLKAASADDQYGGGSGITDVLTNFQYFVKDDAMIANHTVGPVVVGGELKGGKFDDDNNKLSGGVSFGDGAHTPSYAGSVYLAAVGEGVSYGGTCRDFYYGEISNPNAFEGNDLQSFKNRATENPNYIDVDGIFDSIISESQGMVQGATAVTCDNNTIVCDFTGDTNNYSISYEEYCKAHELKIKYSSVSDIKNKKCVINIVGVNEKEIQLVGSYAGYYVNQPAVLVRVDVAGTEYGENYLQALFDDDIQANECNINGMKLIFNLPDAEKLYMNMVGGHIVAPNADMTIPGSNFEGDIICKSMKNYGAEAHYFPFNAIGDMGALEIVVKDDAGNIIPNAKVKIIKPDNSEVTVTTNDSGKVVVEQLPVGEYTTDIIEVPGDYEMPTTTTQTKDVVKDETTNYTYVVTVSDDEDGDDEDGDDEDGDDEDGDDEDGDDEDGDDEDGDDEDGDDEDGDDEDGDDEDDDDVTTEDEEDDVTTGDETSKENGNIVIVVRDEVTDDVVPGAEVKVVDPSGKESTYTTDGNGRIEINDTEPGDYKIIVTKVPDGYTVTTNKETSTNVVAGGTSEVEVVIKKVSSSDKDTNTTSTTTTETTNTTNTDKVVKTGDNTNILMSVVIMLISMAGMLLFQNKKNKTVD